VAPYALASVTTFYTRRGDWFAWLCAIISVVALAHALRTSHKSRQEKLKHPHESRVRQEYQSLSKKVRDSGVIFDADKLRPQLTEIERQSADPNLWSDPQRSKQVMREKSVWSTCSHGRRLGAARRRHCRVLRIGLKKGEEVEADYAVSSMLSGVLVDKLETETLLSGEKRSASMRL